MKRGWMRRLASTLVVSTCVVGLQWSMPPAPWADHGGTVVVVGWGGSFQDCQRQAYFKPFEQETHVKVIEASSPILAKVRAMVESGNVEWDVINQNGSGVLALHKRGLLELIDYSGFNKEDLASTDPRVVLPYAIGNDFYAQGIGYNTKKYSKETHPRTWAEFWDIKKFPGPRALNAGDYVVPPAEIALMADGVSPDKLYPLDLQRAYASLSKIKPHVVKWIKAGSQGPQMINDGEVDLSSVAFSYSLRLKKQGAPIDIEWNQALLFVDFWAIPKKAKNYRNALKFIAFASRPRPQAELCMCMNFGPVNKKSLELIPREQQMDLPSHPDNLKKLVLVNDEWWGEADTAGKSNIEKNIAMWAAWLLN